MIKLQFISYCISKNKKKEKRKSSFNDLFTKFVGSDDLPTMYTQVAPQETKKNKIDESMI